MRPRKKKSLAFALLSIAVLMIVGLFEDKLPSGVREGLLKIVPAIEGHSEPDVAEPIDAPSTQITTSPDIVLDQNRINHILHGDATGGGHKFGAGRPCKSEFPEDWDDTKIINTTKRIAANDNLDWRREDNGYYVTETMHDDVKIRVVLGPEKRKVITSYPLNTRRNPCYNN